MTIQPDSTFWSPDDDRMLDIWVEHGYPESNDVVHLVAACVRLRNIVRQWQGIANELTRHIDHELVQVGGIEWCTVHHGVLDECGSDRTVSVTGHDGELYEFTACDLYDDEGECNVVTLYHFAAPAADASPAADWEQLSLVPDIEVDGLAAAVAAYAGVSPDLVQVIPNREGTPSDQTGGVS